MTPAGNAESTENGAHDAATGKYVWLDFDDASYRTYYEVAGDGDVPLVCLHTAGADSREYRHLLEDERLTDRFTVYAFDMPWHGRTFPPMDEPWWETGYSLTTEFYAGFVMHFVRTLGLDDPVVLGCSMGGEIVLELAAGYTEAVRAVIGLETTDYVDTEGKGYLDFFVDVLEDPRINQEVFRPEWIYGLQAPNNPERYRREAWWIYSQAGDGVYAGDIDFYARDWDARDRLDGIDTDECGCYFLSGEYDFSATPEDTTRVADAIDGATVEVMTDMGHFPPSENPDVFMEYLLPIVDEILDGD